MAITTNTMQNADSICNITTGQVVTDSGAAAAATFLVGFTPRVVEFHNLTDRISDEWIQGMAAASSLHTVAAGTRTLETVHGITVVTGGFTVDSTTLLASKSFYYKAIG